MSDWKPDWNASNEKRKPKAGEVFPAEPGWTVECDGTLYEVIGWLRRGTYVHPVTPLGVPEKDFQVRSPRHGAVYSIDANGKRRFVP